MTVEWKKQPCERCQEDTEGEDDGTPWLCWTCGPMVRAETNAEFVKRYRTALEAIAALDCEHNAVDDEKRKRGEWCDGPCGDIARAALKVTS